MMWCAGLKNDDANHDSLAILSDKIRPIIIDYRQLIKSQQPESQPMPFPSSSVFVPVHFIQPC